MNRKTFIKKTSVGLLVGIPALSLINCSGSDDGTMPDPKPDPDPDPDPQAGDCLENGTSNTISANHGHSLTVSKEDVAAANQKTYTLSAASTDQHIHEVTITPAQFASLKSDNQISATSTNQAGHSHSVTVSCA